MAVSRLTAAALAALVGALSIAPALAQTRTSEIAAPPPASAPPMMPAASMPAQPAMTPGAVLPPAAAHHVVTTADPKAQAAFDRGLALAYAFSVGEARLAFAAAAASDPNLALAYWGEALVETVDINQPQTADGDKRAAAAIALARKHATGITPEERALIDALALRYTTAGTTASRFRAYAGAMTRLAATSADPDVLTLAAFAQWNASDDLLDAKQQPMPIAQTMLRELDAALLADPANIGARHLRIHLAEETRRPELALDDAHYLDGLSYGPGMSHLPHMAGHTYARIGDYAALVASNQRALANDAAYFAQGNGEGQIYTRAYHNHDLEFVLYGLTTQGYNAEAAAVVASEAEAERLHLALRAHDDAALKKLLASETMVPGLRAIALTRIGKLDDARAIALAPHDGSSYAQARTAIAGAIVARAEGRLDAAAAGYRAALKLLGTGSGDPKNYWYIPPGEGLGAVLLQAGKAADAETVFASELKRFPNDPRLAFGLAEALDAQSKDASAARAIVAREWHGARPLTRADLG